MKPTQTCDYSGRDMCFVLTMLVFIQMCLVTMSGDILYNLVWKRNKGDACVIFIVDYVPSNYSFLFLKREVNSAIGDLSCCS